MNLNQWLRFEPDGDDLIVHVGSQKFRVYDASFGQSDYCFPFNHYTLKLNLGEPILIQKPKRQKRTVARDLGLRRPKNG